MIWHFLSISFFVLKNTAYKIYFWRTYHERKAFFHKNLTCARMYYLQNMTKPSVALKFTVIAECSTTRARAALIELPHATVETPVFMPVGTQGKDYPFCFLFGLHFFILQFHLLEKQYFHYTFSWKSNENFR